MRLLHTADWHVGRTVRGRSRSDEHVAVLAEIAAVAARERVDVVLVAGDVFDTAAPTAEAERIVYRALLDLAGTGATVVVVAGNHDNPRRLQAVAPVLRLGRVVTGALVAPPEAGGVVTVEAGGRRARLALLPFLSQREIVRADDLMAAGAAEHAGKYAERARRIIGALCAGFEPEAVNLVVGHVMVTGGVTGGGERSAHTIFDYCVPATAFPTDAHYVALGHLHRTQSVAGPCPIWYAGSPLQLDFGETANEPAVLIVDAAPHRPVEVRPVPLTSGRGLRTVRGGLEDLAEHAGTLGDDHLRVVVEGPSRAGLAERVRELFPDAVDVAVATPGRVERAERPRRLGRSPHELFVEYLAEREATDERVVALFDELLDAAHAPGGPHAPDPA
ncbi:MAG: exonuclease SbcCD subunit D [Actinobacteria bacterium]|nr:exonuclease SbcCD subunit D [Actinomycetota bacterium]